MSPNLCLYPHLENELMSWQPVNSCLKTALPCDFIHLSIILQLVPYGHHMVFCSFSGELSKGQCQPPAEHPPGNGPATPEEHTMVYLIT